MTEQSIRYFNFPRLKSIHHFTADGQRMLLLSLVTVLYVVFANAVAQFHGISEYSEIFRASKIGMTTLSVTLGVILISHFLGILTKRKSRNPFQVLWEDIRLHVLQRDLLITRTVPVATLIVFLASFVYTKSLVSVFNPFSFDEAFFQLDRVLSFGEDPWRLTHAIFGGPLTTFFIDWAYNAWFGVKWLVFFLFVIKVNKPGLRLQYFLVSFLCWILLGSIGATLLSSAGPVYYEHIVGSTAEYGPLMERLYQIDADLKASGIVGIKALETQQMLWFNHSLGEQNLVSGISAMPSMHVSIAVLMALGTWGLNRTLGIVMSIYALIIMIGSVHLGWHYAVDGYLSAIGTTIIWFGTGALIRRLGLGDEKAIKEPQTSTA